ncbi:MAG: glycosyltransferase [Planctomycetes bacterium]|nr:glycosyltransferase [Planctomycetota bacterium]
MPTISPPDIAYDTSENSYRPSWSEQPGYINSEHEQIFEATKHIPGFQDPADSEKLYEVAYHCGAIMLEIGVFGGRSAVVQLRGALAAHKERGGSPPQYYGLDTDPLAIRRTTKSLQSASLLEPAMLYHGSLVHFHRDIPIVPTMVFVDGDHAYESVWSDLRILSTFLGPHTPVFCHDYVDLTGVRRAVDEWIQRGAFEPMGLFAGSMLLRSSARVCRDRAGTLSPQTFDHARRALLTRYLSADSSTAKGLRHRPVADLTRAVRRELLAGASKRLLSGRGNWPWVNPDPTPLPDAMPDGSPWPRISIVTPSFNQGRYIEQTILSIANQDYPDVEHIVIDGGSTDETPAVLDRYANHLAHVISEPDQGQSDAINKGFSRATGEIFTWINSDDMLAPGALAAAAMAITGSDGRRAADGSTGADFVTGICRVFDQAWPDGKLVQQSLTSIPQGPMPLHELLDIERCWLAGRFWWQPDCLFTRDLWERAGGHVRLDWYYSMDYELWLRMAEARARVRVIGRPICLYRAHEAQKTAEDEGGGFRGELPKAAQEFCDTRNLTRPMRSARSNQPLRVAFLSDIGFQFGAGIAHRRIAAGFAHAGHDVFPFALARSNNDAIEFDTGDVVGSIAACEPDLVLVGNLHGAGIDPVRAMDLLGADKFVLLLRDDGRGDYEVAMSEGLTASDTLYANGRYGVGDPMVDEALDTGVLQIGPYPRSQAIAVVPLSVQQSTVGVLVLLKLLSHKPALRAGDRDMLDLLGAHAASALFAARLFAATDRKRRTLEGLMQLVRGA